MYFTPRNVFCAGGGEAESDDPDADPDALKKARCELQADAEQDAFAMAHYKAGRYASQHWLQWPDLHALMGDRGASLSNCVVRGCFFWDLLTQYGRCFAASPAPCSKGGCGGSFEPIGAFSTKGARFAHTLSGGFYLYRFRCVCSIRKDKNSPRKA